MFLPSYLDPWACLLQYQTEKILSLLFAVRSQKNDIHILVFCCCDLIIIGQSHKHNCKHILFLFKFRQGCGQLLRQVLDF